MDPATLKSIQDQIEQAGQFAAGVAGIIDPEIIPLIILGKALSVAVPSLVDDVEKLLAQTEPTDADNAALAAKIAKLADPGSI